MNGALMLVIALLGQPPAQERLDRIRADLFSRVEHLDDDVRELKEILAADPKSAEAHTLLGIAYRASGSPELIGESVAEFREALELDPTMTAVRFYLAHDYLDLGRALRAREELETALAQSPGKPEFLALLGETERQLKNPTRAVELLRQALQTDESNAQARYYLGLALYDLGQKEEAITELERVVRSSPEVADPYLALGTAYLDAGRAADAVRTFEKGTSVNPNLPELHIQLARAYRLSGSLQKAEAQLALAAPKGAGASAASDYQRQQIELDLYLERGLLKLREGQLAAAADAFKKVLEADTNNEAAQRGLAEVRRRQAAARKKKTGGRE
jgi:tetratricopeptide (TPR) repeat protein